VGLLGERARADVAGKFARCHDRSEPSQLRLPTSPDHKVCGVLSPRRSPRIDRECRWSLERSDRLRRYSAFARIAASARGCTWARSPCFLRTGGVVAWRGGLYPGKTGT